MANKTSTVIEKRDIFVVTMGQQGPPGPPGPPGGGGGGPVDASDVVVAPAGNLASTDAQAALEELQVDIDGRALAGHNHTGVYSPVGHDHAGVYSPVGHDHAGVYSPVGHAHAAGDITSGTMATARLGSGTANSAAFLRGDNTWSNVLVASDFRLAPAAGNAQFIGKSDTGTSFEAHTVSSAVGASLFLQSGAAANFFLKAYNGADISLTGASDGSLSWNGVQFADSSGLMAGALASGTVPSARIDWASPGTLGSTTPSTGAVTTLAVGLGAGVAPSRALHVADTLAGVGVVAQIWNMTAVAAGVGAAMNFQGGVAGNGLAAIGAAFAGAATTDGAYLTFSTRAITSGTLTERMRIDANGNVGIGVTPSTLHAHTGTLGVWAGVFGHATGYVSVTNMYRDSGGTWKHIAAGRGTAMNHGSGSFQFYGSTSGSADAAVSFALNMNIDDKGNVVVGSAALATTATDGFLYIPSCAGTPTGVPTAYTGRIPIVFDTTNDRLWAYRGAWQMVAFI